MAMIILGSGSTLNGEGSDVVEVTVAADCATGAGPRDHSYYILEAMPDFSIHISHNDWFDEYNYRLSMEDKHTTGYLIF